MIWPHFSGDSQSENDYLNIVVYVNYHNIEIIASALGLVEAIGMMMYLLQGTFCHGLFSGWLV